MTNLPVNNNQIISFRHPRLGQKSDGKIFCFKNCRRLFREGVFVQQANEQELWVRDGLVLDPLKVFFGERRRPDVHVDCEGLTLAPGFIDIQVNGAFGVDFTTLAASEDYEEASKLLLLVAQKLLQYGVTAFCPTLITAPPKAYKNFLRLLKDFGPSTEKTSSSILGAHFEGPFISAGRSGCHPKQSIMSSLKEEDHGIIDAVYGQDLSHLSIVTLAPELEGAVQSIERLCHRGIKVSIGHSNASLQQAQAAVEAGASCVTHLFCAMTPFNHRNPGIVGILPENKGGKQLFFGIIADGIHLAESAIQLAFCANPKGQILITDCISALGLGDGTYQLGGQQITVEGTRALVNGTDTLAGSVSSMVHCVKFFANCIGKLPNRDGLAEALRAATYNPATFLGIGHRKGTLAVGSDADFVLVDDQLNIHSTFVGGLKCFDGMSNLELLQYN